MTRSKWLLLLLVFAACAADRKPDTQRRGGRDTTVVNGTRGGSGRIDPDGNILADTFEILSELQGEHLTISLHSDLPDVTTVMVSIQRTFRTNEDADEYVVEYLSERSTVGAWRKPRTIVVSNDAWKQRLTERRRMLGVGGEPFTVRSINDTMTIGFTVPINQDEPFAESNANLRGKAVELNDHGWRLINRDVALHYPIDTSDLDQSRWADPLDLRVEETYELSRPTPLVPEIEPADPIAAIEQIQQLAVGTHVQVREVTHRRNSPWYRVQVVVNGQVKSVGWINSTALLGQELKAVNP